MPIFITKPQIKFHDNIDRYALSPGWMDTWPLTTDIHCYWCCHAHDNVPVPLPVARVRQNIFICHGMFCSFNCAKSFAASMKNMALGNCGAYLASICRQMTLYFYMPLLKLEPDGWHVYMDRKGVIPALPRSSLIPFGGQLTIDKYRSGFLVVRGVLDSDAEMSTVRWKVNASSDSSVSTSSASDVDENNNEQNAVSDMTSLINLTTQHVIQLQPNSHSLIDQKSRLTGTRTRTGAGTGTKSTETDESVSSSKESLAKLQKVFAQSSAIRSESKRVKRITETNQRIVASEKAKQIAMQRKKSTLASSLNIAITFQETL